MTRITLFRLVAGSGLILLGAAIAAWSAYVAFGAWALAGLFGLRHLEDLVIGTAMEIAAVFCSGVALFGFGLWLLRRRGLRAVR